MFRATFRPHDPDGQRPTWASPAPSRCATPVTKTADHTFVIEPTGPGGEQVVDVFGWGPEGDLVATFIWTLSEPGAPCRTR